VDIDLIIDAIYGAGSDPSQWQFLLASLTTAFRGVGAAMHVGDAENSFSFGVSYNFDPDALSAYEQYFFSINPLNQPLTLADTGRAVGDHELVPRKYYHHSEFYNDFALRFGLNGSVTAVLGKNGGQVSCLGVVTGTNSDPYSADELKAFQRLVPHVRRALDLNKRLAALQATGEAAQFALDLVNFGVVLVGEKGRVIRTNRIAEAMLKAKVGLSILGGFLHINDSVTNSRLLTLIDTAVRRSGERGGSLAISRPDGRPIFARVVPYYPSNFFPDVPIVRAFIYLRDPDIRSPSDVREFASSFGLTQSERQVLECLLDVPDAGAVASSLGIATVTARNHIARIMAKTGTHKQAELLQLVLTSRLPILE